ncbi:hypothetical protein CSEC_0040 [Criblamydia sequanensis CRIB-18]|uniref:Hydrogenase nickel incorporation protein HypA n=1 Tax=Candidatus Criblamydia sequanensis CRIB-18 TaxID=1437425 RepID=A0A090DV43_9BACT|nr:hypothetical protein CSEC_0040 [Criblamydia sequanensis CRIB-18]
MIEVSIDKLILIYFGVTFTFVGLLWGLFYLQKGKAEKILVKNQVKHCEFCHFRYLIDLRKNLTRCPECGLLNDERK